MGLSETPRQAWPTPLLDKKMIDASRTEILVVALGILFLVSQLCLMIWIFARPHAFARRREPRPKAATSPPDSRTESNGSANDNDSPKPLRKLRRSSTWSGGSLERQYLRQRRKSGGRGQLGQIGTPSSSPETESDSDLSTQKGIEDMGGMIPAFAMPSPAPPLRHLGHSLNSLDAGPATEMKEFDPRKVWREMGFIAAAIAKPGSPRSPRLNAVDQAAIIAALTADDGGTKAPSPTPAVVEDVGTLASGFDDPLGVNRKPALTGKRTDTALSASGSDLRVRSV